MSVLSHLNSKANDCIMPPGDAFAITTSINTIQTRLTSFFGTEIRSQFRFGSSTRGTNLPRSMDSNSDIDYMVVFDNAQFAPQTYLDKLKRFVTHYYSTSEIYQSHPTIVIEMNHIKFDLVPAKISYLSSGYSIPDRQTQWQSTNPNDFNQSLTAINGQYNNLIKPTVRLVKYWNAYNGGIYDSFALEKYIIGLNFWGCMNLRDFVFKVFDSFNAYNVNEIWRRDKVVRAKEIIASVRVHEQSNAPLLAEQQIKRLMP